MFKSKLKIGLIIAGSGLCLFAFQNCGDIKVSENVAPPAPSIQAKGISGKICASTQPVSAVSRYTIDRFMILNLTASPRNNVLEMDSNINGVIDRIESPLGAIATVKLTNADTDGDGIPDFIEELRGTTSSRDDMFEDGSDQDGILNYDELVRGSDPTSSMDPPELNAYDVTEVPAESGCDASQKIYKFSVRNLQRVSTDVLSDAVNSGATSLSHDADENVYLIYAHMQPERITETDKKLFRIFRVKKTDTDFYLNLNMSDFSELPPP